MAALWAHALGDANIALIFDDLIEIIHGPYRLVCEATQSRCIEEYANVNSLASPDVLHQGMF